MSTFSPSASPSSLTWNTDPVYGDIVSDVCTIERVSYDAMTPDTFFRFYEEQRPVILSYPVDTTAPRNGDFQRAVQKQQLLDHHGSDEITLSTGNRNSYAKRNTTLADYLQHYLHPQPESVPGNASWYHFGDPHHQYWREVNGLYEAPWKFMHAYQDPALSFGFAGSGTGVPFHTHGAVFAEALYGRKRWWLSAPHEEPRYDPDANTLHWLRHVRPTYSATEVASLYECVCGRGDVIYIPSNWHHATLNIGEAVFMSVFL
jgi:ribosomal protein L16 Arg81 hydroxylase